MKIPSPTLAVTATPAPVSSASAAPIGAVHPDASLLSLRAELHAAALQLRAIDLATDVSDEDMDNAIYRLSNVCNAIVDNPPAQTFEGIAFKAAAAMHRLRVAFGLDIEADWPGYGEEMAWHVLSEIAGNAYAPSASGRAEPPRRATQSAGRPGSPDAELIRTCIQFAETELDGWYRFVIRIDKSSGDQPSPDWDRLHWITATPATTPEGWRAKALVYSAWASTAYDDEPDSREPRSTLLAGLLRDMVAPMRNAIIARLAAKYGPLPHGYTPEGIWLGAAIAYGEAATVA